MSDMRDLLGKLKKRLSERSDNEYLRMMETARRGLCIGWEAKLALGEFGREELSAHKDVSAALGRHRAFAQVCRELDEILKETTDETEGVEGVKNND